MGGAGEDHDAEELMNLREGLRRVALAFSGLYFLIAVAAAGYDGFGTGGHRHEYVLTTTDGGKYMVLAFDRTGARILLDDYRRQNGPPPPDPAAPWNNDPIFAGQATYHHELLPSLARFVIVLAWWIAVFIALGAGWTALGWIASGFTAPRATK